MCEEVGHGIKGYTIWYSINICDPLCENPAVSEKNHFEIQRKLKIVREQSASLSLLAVGGS